MVRRVLSRALAALSAPATISAPTALLAAALTSTALASTAFTAGLAAQAAEATPQAVELREGSSVSGTLAAGDTARYSVEVGEDYFVFGEVDQISVDVVVRVLDADGVQVGRVDGPARGAERFTEQTDEAGVYTIEVIPFEDETGEYRITLHRLEPLATDADDLVDQLMSPYDGDDTPGAAVRAWRDGETLFSEAYGMANLAYDIPFETDTRTNIGSTSKQFTAFAVLLQAERGALSLDDDIREHIPELPEFEHTIRVEHLLTHTSGLREFLNLLVMTGRSLEHGDWIDREELIRIVQRQPALQNEPGTEWNYNNTAFGLAALIVERTSGQDFHDYMRENVFEPLGMTRTMVRPNPEAIVPDRSVGYAPGGSGFRQVRDLGGAVGAGGIYTTVADLQRWVENYANPRVGTPEMIQKMMTPFELADEQDEEAEGAEEARERDQQDQEEDEGYGYGLFIDHQRGLRRVHHGGADAAHRSMLAYYPEIGAGITVQSNHAGFDSSVAFELAEAFFGDAMEPEEDDEAVAEAGDFDPEDYDPEDFDPYVGRYALDAAPNFILTFSRRGDTLFTQATNQPELRILPTSDSTFTLTAVEASLVFHRTDDGEVEGLTLTQSGQEQHATRIDEDESPAWEPAPEELEEFTGRYFSEELETFYDIALEDEELVVHHRRMEDVTLGPTEKDTFSGRNMTFSFERDRNGRVIGFYLANVRTRDVRFERVR